MVLLLSTGYKDVFDVLSFPGCLRPTLVLCLDPLLVNALINSEGFHLYFFYYFINFTFRGKTPGAHNLIISSNIWHCDVIKCTTSNKPRMVIFNNDYFSLENLLYHVMGKSHVLCSYFIFLNEICRIAKDGSV
jgi:hypothetical protein